MKSSVTSVTAEEIASKSGRMRRPQGLKSTISARTDAALEGPLFHGRASGGRPAQNVRARIRPHTWKQRHELTDSRGSTQHRGRAARWTSRSTKERRGGRAARWKPAAPWKSGAFSAASSAPKGPGLQPPWMFPKTQCPSRSFI
jgi:hypothetical protein